MMGVTSQPAPRRAARSPPDPLGYDRAEIRAVVAGPPSRGVVTGPPSPAPLSAEPVPITSRPVVSPLPPGPRRSVAGVYAGRHVQTMPRISALSFHPRRRIHRHLSFRPVRQDCAGPVECACQRTRPGQTRHDTPAPPRADIHAPETGRYLGSRQDVIPAVSARPQHTGSRRHAHKLHLSCYPM